MDKCPLCDNPMESLYGSKTKFHYWCDPCNHGWYIADLKNITGQNLVYTVSKGKQGKSPQVIKELILKRDKEGK